jgi:hypothetical protein
MEETNRAMIQRWEEQAVKAEMLKISSPFTDFRLPDEPLSSKALLLPNSQG